MKNTFAQKYLEHVFGITTGPQKWPEYWCHGGQLP